VRIAWFNPRTKEAGTSFLDVPEIARSTIREWISVSYSPEHMVNTPTVRERSEAIADGSRELSIREIHLDRGLSEVANTWKKFLATFPDHPLDCEPDWLEQHFRHEKDRIRIFLLERHDQIVGVVPCRIHQTLACKLGEFTITKLPLRILEFLVAPNIPAENPAYDLLFEQVVKSGSDAIHLAQVRTESFTWHYVRRRPVIQDLFSYYIPSPPKERLMIRLEDSFETYMNKFPPKTRKNRLREIKHLRERGELTLIRITEPSEVDAFFETAHGIRQRTWQYARFGRAWAGPDADAVRGDLLFLAKRGWLRSYLLRSGNVPCSFVLGYQYGGRFCAYSAGVDRAWRRYSAGTVTLLLVLQDLFKENTPQLYDFGTPVMSKEYLANAGYAASDVWLFRRRPYCLLAGRIYRGCDAISTQIGRGLGRLRLKSKVRQLLRR
jgi:hypothetical protein